MSVKIANLSRDNSNRTSLEKNENKRPKIGLPPLPINQLRPNSTILKENND